MATLANVNVALTTTSATNVVNVTTPSAGNYVAYAYVEVTGAATGLTLQLSWTSPSGAQTQTIVPATTLKSVGDYTLVPIYFRATASTSIKVTATAATANHVTVCSTVVEF